MSRCLRQVDIIISSTCTNNHLKLLSSVKHFLVDDVASHDKSFNIGNSLLEIAFLAGSAVLTDSDGNIVFLFVCLYSAVVFLFFLPKLKSSN